MTVDEFFNRKDPFKGKGYQIRVEVEYYEFTKSTWIYEIVYNPKGRIVEDRNGIRDLREVQKRNISLYKGEPDMAKTKEHYESAKKCIYNELLPENLEYIEWIPPELRPKKKPYDPDDYYRDAEAGLGPMPEIIDDFLDHSDEEKVRIHKSVLDYPDDDLEPEPVSAYEDIDDLDDVLDLVSAYEETDDLDDVLDLVSAYEDIDDLDDDSVFDHLSDYVDDPFYSEEDDAPSSDSDDCLLDDEDKKNIPFEEKYPQFLIEMDEEEEKEFEAFLKHPPVGYPKEREHKEAQQETRKTEETE